MGSPSKKKKNCKVTDDCLLQIDLLHRACPLQVLDRVKDETKLWSIFEGSESIEVIGEGEHRNEIAI